MKPEEICHDQSLEKPRLVRTSLVEPEVSGRMKGLFAMCSRSALLLRQFFEKPSQPLHVDGELFRISLREGFVNL